MKEKMVTKAVWVLTKIRLAQCSVVTQKMMKSLVGNVPEKKVPTQTMARALLKTKRQRPLERNPLF
jgi:hypothetical protein